MKVIIQKNDLDTCMTALLLNIKNHDHVIVSKGNAKEADLEDPETVCIEAGGCGLVHLNNFDHHDASNLPPACIQAINYINIKDKQLQRLADYIRLIDTAKPLPCKIRFPSFSNLFSGMKMVENDNDVEQFFAGIKLLNRIIELNLDPFQSMPERKEWTKYIETKQINWAMASASLANTKFYYTKHNRKLGFCSQNNIGGIGTILRMGCDIAILYSELFGKSMSPKYTIAGNNIALYDLLSILNKYEPGWGGHQNIIGSPREHTTTLTTDQIINIIIQIL